jgi:hypothetical protein
VCVCVCVCVCLFVCVCVSIEACVRVFFVSTLNYNTVNGYVGIGLAICYCSFRNSSWDNRQATRNCDILYTYGVVAFGLALSLFCREV